MTRVPSLPLLFVILAMVVIHARAQDIDPGELEFAVRAPLAPRSLLLDAATVPSDGLMVAVGERGHILRSLDQGQTWLQAEVPTRATLTGVFLYDSTLGWAVGHDAIILKTTDGAETWEVVHFAPQEERPFLDVWFRDESYGLAIGAYGFLLRTFDGGETWASHGIGTALSAEGEDLYDDFGADFHLNHIARSANGRLFIAAEAGTVYRSDDDGETWTSLPSSYHGSFFGTLPLQDDALLLFGLRGHLYHSADAGASWQRVTAPTEAMLTDGRVLADGTVVLVGLGGTVLVSRDSGVTFNLRQQANRAGLSAVLETSDAHLVLIGEDGIRRLPKNAYMAD